MEPCEVRIPPHLPRPAAASEHGRTAPTAKSPMPAPRELPTPRELLDRLETRHDELIRKLDELNVQIEETLAQFIKARGGANGTTSAKSETPVADAVADERRFAGRRS